MAAICELLLNLQRGALRVCLERGGVLRVEATEPRVMLRGLLEE